MGMIVLPQALRIVILTNVGQFISLFRDTSLVVVAFSLLDLLGIARSVVSQNEFLGLRYRDAGLRRAGLLGLRLLADLCEFTARGGAWRRAALI